MCRDIQHGGQRCAAETRKGVTTATEAVQAAEENLRSLERGNGGPDSDRRDAHVKVAEAYAALKAAHIEHASTPSGQKEYAAEQVKAFTEKDTAEFSHRYWDEVLDRGADLAQRNKDIGSAMKDVIAERAQRKADAQARVAAPTSGATAGDHAVCDACGWEGPEDQAPGGHCPQCKQDEVNYFHRPLGVANPNHVTVDSIEPGDQFYWDGEVHVLDTIEENPDDPDTWLVETARMNLEIPKSDLVERLEDEPEPWEPTAAEIEAWARDDEAQVAGDPAPTGRAKLISRAAPALTKLSEDEFEDQYGPIHQSDLDPDANTYWDEPPTAYPADRIWTVVETGENDNQYLLPGVHHVNRIGYIASQKPWTDPNVEVLYFDYAANMHPDALRNN